jgi:hypothetical protein
LLEKIYRLKIPAEKYPANYKLNTVDSTRIHKLLLEQISPFDVKFELNDKQPSVQFKPLRDDLASAPPALQSIVKTTIFNCFLPFAKEICAHDGVDDKEDVDQWFVEVYDKVRSGSERRTYVLSHRD